MATIKRINDHQLVRYAINRDLPDMLRIEKENSDYPLSEDEFLLKLKERTVIGSVYTNDDEIIGFLVYGVNRGFYDIVNLSIDKNWQRKGIGTNYVDVIKNKLDNSPSRDFIQTMVRESDLSLQLFFREQGLKGVLVFNEWFEDTSEDGYLMEFKKKKSGVYVPKNRVSEHLNGTPIW